MHIRNFVIISHVDHGKSTLADRMLELTGTVPARKMRPQYLDQMELEREKGITIKMQPVRMIWRMPNHETINPKSEILNQPNPQNLNDPKARLGFRVSGLEFADLEQEFVLNLIDTPGHADFSYEVSRALAAVEGAILLVDAAQGVQAQTISNLELARRQGLTIIPVINKIDLASARIAETERELAALTGSKPADILRISARTGEGVAELLRAIIQRIPPPAAGLGPARALVFDSHFDPYRGVIAHIRVFDGSFLAGESVSTLATAQAAEAAELGFFAPDLTPAGRLGAGEIGYMATGLKDPAAIRVGDTIARLEISPPSAARPRLASGETGEPGRGRGNLKLEIGTVEPLPGYREPQPVVFASLYPEDPDAYERLQEALAKIKLSDAAIVFEPESSAALGRGFRLGFLGMLHLDIAGERLRREYGLKLIFAPPSVAYRIVRADGLSQLIYSASHWPEVDNIREIAEPWVRLEIVAPAVWLGAVMALLGRTRGRHRGQTNLGADRLAVAFDVPLRDILVGFSDRLKSVTAGYGSFGYQLIGYQPGDLVRLDVFIAGKREPALSQIVPRSQAYRAGRRVTEKLKDLLPRQLFAVSVQASVGGRVIARETLPALKKDVAGYLYGGDRTRKMKLWARQKRGKRRLAGRARVEIPPAVFYELMRDHYS